MGGGSRGGGPTSRFWIPGEESLGSGRNLRRSSLRRQFQVRTKTGVGRRDPVPLLVTPSSRPGTHNPYSRRFFNVIGRLSGRPASVLLLTRSSTVNPTDGTLHVVGPLGARTNGFSEETPYSSGTKDKGMGFKEPSEAETPYSFPSSTHLHFPRPSSTLLWASLKFLE